jgi:hypothetical protein
MAFILIAYFIFIIGYIIYSVAGIYHLWRFGYIGDLTKPAVIFYIIASSIVIIFTVTLILFRPWPVDFSI